MQGQNKRFRGQNPHQAKDNPKAASYGGRSVPQQILNLRSTWKTEKKEDSAPVGQKGGKENGAHCPFPDGGEAYNPGSNLFRRIFRVKVL